MDFCWLDWSMLESSSQSSNKLGAVTEGKPEPCWPWSPYLTVWADIFFFETKQRQGCAKDSWKKINIGTNWPFPWDGTFIDAALTPWHSNVSGCTFQCPAFLGWHRALRHKLPSAALLWKTQAVQQEAAACMGLAISLLPDTKLH